MVVFLCWCGGVFVVVLWPENSYFFSLCQHPARELVLVAVLQDCGGVFGVFVVVFLVFLWWWCRGINIRPENLYFSAFCKIVVLVWVFFAVFVVVVQWWQHPARELVLFGVLQDCGFGLAVFVVVFLKWSGGVFVVVVQWCQHLVFLWWWCGGVNIRPENSCLSVFCNKDVLVRGITTL